MRCPKCIKEAIELCLEVEGETIGPDLLAKILRDCELTREQLRDLL